MARRSSQKKRRKRPTYSYSPLPATRSIRLLVLEPAKKPKDRLKASLLLTELDATCEYEAISYAWGEPIFNRHLELSDDRLPITENLASALRVFRDPDRPRTLWVDAVCINQKDEKERGH